MSTLTKTPERLIADYHNEEYDRSPILSIDWVGDLVFADEEASRYMVETESGRYRYTFGLEQQVVLDAEYA